MKTKNKESYKKQIEYYRKMFDYDYEILDISKRENHEILNKNYSKVNIKEITRTIDKNKSKLINNFVRKNKVSKTAFFLSIYGYVLSKYSGQDIVYSSMVVVNRNISYTENMIGMFVSTQPLILKYNNENLSFKKLIKENIENLMNMYKDQNISFSELKKELNLKKAQ